MSPAARILIGLFLAPLGLIMTLVVMKDRVGLSGPMSAAIGCFMALVILFFTIISAASEAARRKRLAQTCPVKPQTGGLMRASCGLVTVLGIASVKPLIGLLAEHMEMVWAVIWGMLLPILVVALFIRQNTRRLQREMAWAALRGSGDIVAYSAKALKAQGFRTEIVQKPPDMGADLVAWNRKAKLAIRCVWQEQPVGTGPLRDLIGGMAYYQASHAAVIAVSGFDAEAQKLARENRIILLDYDRLDRLHRSIRQQG